VLNLTDSFKFSSGATDKNGKFPTRLAAGSYAVTSGNFFSKYA